MKKILAILSMTGILFLISGRGTAQTGEKLPIRTADLHPVVQRTVPGALPMKSGGGEKTITSVRPGDVKVTLPPLKPGGTMGPGGTKVIPAGRPGVLQPGGAPGVTGTTGGASSAKLPIKGAGTGGTNKP
jgi:hypothetical protein